MLVGICHEEGIPGVDQHINNKSENIYCKTGTSTGPVLPVFLDRQFPENLKNFKSLGTWIMHHMIALN